MFKLARIGNYPTSTHNKVGFHAYNLFFNDKIKTLYISAKIPGTPLPLNKNAYLKRFNFLLKAYPLQEIFIKRIIFNLNRIISILNFSLKTILFLQNKKINIIHIHSPMYILVAIWGYLTKKYIYISFHGEEIRKVKNSFFYKKIAFIFNAVFCISKPLLDELKKIHSQPIYYIGNGIDDKEFVDLSLVKKKQILFVAKFKKVKRHKLIIDGFAKFISNKQFSDYQLLLAGDGDLLDEIMTYVENNKFNNVNFLGNKTSSELVKIYNESEVFALTSEREGFPKVILEAIACDCKIVSTNVGSIDEILGKDYPFFILSDKPDEVCRILTKSVKNDFKIDKDKILKKFNWERIRNKYLNIYMNDLNDKI